MKPEVRFAWDITEEGCFKTPLVRLPKTIYKGEKDPTQWHSVNEFLVEDHWINQYDVSKNGFYWFRKPEYL